MKGVVIGLFDSLVDGALRRISLRARAGETYSGRRIMQHYGFMSSPQADCEVLAIENGGMVVIVAEDDRRYRLTIEQGEAALYDDQGQYVLLKRGKEIEISGCDKLSLGGVRDGLQRLVDERVSTWLNAHTHTTTTAGNPTSAPITPVVITTVSTDITRAK